jgi:hypothetical protein
LEVAGLLVEFWAVNEQVADWLLKEVQVLGFQTMRKHRGIQATHINI